MFETRNYNAILNEMLEQIPNTMDKREGSVIYNSIAPFAMQLSELYKRLDNYLKELFPTTATEKYLDEIVGMFGVTRNKASYSVRLGVFYDSSNNLMDIEVGKRFSIDGIIYSATSKISTGNYRMTCEVAGEEGNIPNGSLLPIDTISNLGIATLTDILVEGENEETDEELRTRFYEYVNSIAFGGNIADYKQKVKEVPGIGAVKVIPTWNGGGTVKLIILDSTLNAAGPRLVTDVEIAVGENGSGIAPIGHTVTVVSASNCNIAISLNLTVKSGYSQSVVIENIESAINIYFSELKEEWEDSSSLIVRIVHVESRIISAEGVEDISNLRINNATSNITLENNEIPYLSGVTIND